MSKILLPSPGPWAWQQFLAKPDLQWVTGYSAKTLAYAWEASGGMPPEIDAALAQAFGPAETLLVIPERKTPLPGGRRESQSDVFVLVRHAGGLAACTIEGKVDEPFGPTVSDWMVDASAGKIERLNYICGLLGLRDCPPDIHYQLLHRTAAALIEADRFCANDAAMIVHSYSPERRWFAAFERFAGLFGRALLEDAVVFEVPSGRRLLLAWVNGEQHFRSM